ncbi:hypothetical protein AVEN_205917-1 [Araneus ventricosus]|uniref:Uncharacterized protein n=1 Tax=Araneus ventricosus TaxID=182803 RepID=A0A4Y2HH68_ARAVE|nr:hypothetical protein AVEN_205917-1 [Araneus ventricosus]
MVARRNNSEACADDNRVQRHFHSDSGNSLCVALEKMVRQLETYFNVEVRGTVRFFVGKTFHEYGDCMWPIHCHYECHVQSLANGASSSKMFAQT